LLARTRRFQDLPVRTNRPDDPCPLDRGCRALPGGDRAGLPLPAAPLRFHEEGRTRARIRQRVAARASALIRGPGLLVPLLLATACEPASPPSAAPPTPTPTAARADPPPADRARATAELERGQRLFAQGELIEARAAFESATRADATLAPAWLGLGRTLVLPSAGMSFSHALDCLAQALALDPALVEAHWALGLAHYGLVDYEAAQRELERYLADAGEAAPRDMRGEAEHLLGVLARTRGELAVALAHLARAEALHPGVADIPYERGLTLEAANRDDEAVAAFEAAIAADRNHVPSRFRLARAYRRQGRNDDAAREERIHRALNGLFDNSTGRDAKDPKRRAELWGEIAGLDPGNRKARLEYARALVELQRDGEAAVAVDDLVRGDATFLEAHVLGVELALKRGDRVGAAARVKALRAARPDATVASLPVALRPLWETP
jgi:tetratricopeptide (TPR) repeat protein